LCSSVTERNAFGTARALSLASSGEVYERTREVDRQFASKDTEARGLLVQPDDLVVNPMWLIGGGIGVSNLSGQVSPDYRVYRPGPHIVPRYLHHVVRSNAYRDQFQLWMRAETTFDRRVSRDDFESLLLPVPPMAEQRKIADFLDFETARIDKLLELRKTQLALLDQRLEAEVRSALTGADAPRRVTSGNQWFPALPDGWAAARLKTRWRVIDCKHRTPVYVDDGYPLVSTGDITPGRLDLRRTTRFVDEHDFLDLADKPRRPRRGDIVYSRNASLGTACYVDTDEPFTMGQDVCRITSDNQRQLILAYALNYLAAPQIEQRKVGATFSRINVEEILNLVIPFPLTAQEQADVGVRCDQLVASRDGSSALIRRSIELLVERRTALITAAVTGQLDVTTARGVA